MDAATVSQEISSLGFPIAACVAIARYYIIAQKSSNETISKLSDALNNNTLALTKLTDEMHRKG